MQNQQQWPETIGHCLDCHQEVQGWSLTFPGQPKFGHDWDMVIITLRPDLAVSPHVDVCSKCESYSEPTHENSGYLYVGHALSGRYITHIPVIWALCLNAGWKIVSWNASICIIVGPTITQLETFLNHCIMPIWILWELVLCFCWCNNKGIWKWTRGCEECHPLYVRWPFIKLAHHVYRICSTKTKWSCQ